MHTLILQNQLIAVRKQVSDVCLELKYSRGVDCFDDILEMCIGVMGSLRDIEEFIEDNLK